MFPYLFEPLLNCSSFPFFNVILFIMTQDAQMTRFKSYSIPTMQLAVRGFSTFSVRFLVVSGGSFRGRFKLKMYFKTDV